MPPAPPPAIPPEAHGVPTPADGAPPQPDDPNPGEQRRRRLRLVGALPEGFACDASIAADSSQESSAGITTAPPGEPPLGNGVRPGEDEQGFISRMARESAATSRPRRDRAPGRGEGRESDGIGDSFAVQGHSRSRGRTGRPARQHSQHLQAATASEDNDAAPALPARPVA